MGNKVTTRCRVIGPGEDVYRFASTFLYDDGKGFDFNKVIPVPKGPTDTCEICYGWRKKYWATGCNVSELNITSIDPLEFTFETAWSFPKPVLEKLAELYPELGFYCACYEEAGNFAGKGFFNPIFEDPAFEYCDATDEIYEHVFGEPPETYDEDDEDD